jgi:type IV pilus assembly protein PilE
MQGRGFTIVELMIAVLIVGVLLALAYPSFADQMRKSRRSDAIAALTSIQQAQERWRGNNPGYTDVFNTATPPAAANGLSASNTTASGYYNISIPTATAAVYVLVATAVASKSQAQDGNCKLIGIRNGIDRLQYGSGALLIDWTAAEPDVGRCWAR